MGEKLNTAEYDKKGRCVRHPAIRLRKKKIFGGWKIIIGHCPECCLDEMRRVRDEIGAEDDNDDHNRHSSKRRSRKEKKKKRSDRDRDGHRRSSKHHNRHGGRSEDSVSEAGSQPSRGYRASAEGGDRGPMMPEGPSMGHIDEQSPHHHPQAPHIRHDGESTGTGSTAQNSSMDGSSEYRHGGGSGQHVGYPQHGHHGGGGGRDGGYYQQQQPDNNNNFPPPPPQPQRTMVLSMAFTDPQTGQRGTYTGQVNSINHKPDGKGTVYYANGNIAEGTWAAGMLLDDDENSSHSGSHSQREQQQQYEPRGASRGRPQNVNRSRDMGGGGYGSAPPARGEEMGYVDNNAHHDDYHHPPSNTRSRSTSRSRDPSGMASPPPPPPRRHRDASRDSLNRQHSSSGSSRRVNPPPPPPTASSGFTGNLDKLDSLGGKKKSRRAPRGASASVQSYNSREGPNIPSGSASVQMEYGGSGRVFGDHMSSPLNSSSASMSGFDSSRGSGIVYDGGGGGSVGYNNNEYRRRDSRGHSQPHHSHHGSSGRNPPGYR